MVYTTLCLSGGGINGLNILGSLKYLIDTNIIKQDELYIFIGTSVGSIISVMLSIGYEINELIRKIYNIDFDNLEIDPDIDTLILNLGLDNGNNIMSLIQTLIYEKTGYNDFTFEQHYNLTNKTLKLVAVNYHTQKDIVFSHETTPELSIIKAIRMSISIPLIFTPIEHEGQLYIDGGLVNNFAFNYGEKDKTIGICLSYDIDYKNINLITYLFGVISIFMNNVTVKENENVINLKINYENMINFSPDKNIKKKLFKNGYKNTMKICNNNLNFYSTIFVNKIIKESINEYINNTFISFNYE